jgi:hypothetical protein
MYSCAVKRELGERWAQGLKIRGKFGKCAGNSRSSENEKEIAPNIVKEIQISKIGY